MGRKFHHNYSQSEATNQGYRCDPLWRRQLGSGKVSSSNSSSRTSRTSSSSGSSSSSSSSSDKTRQDKARQLAYFRRLAIPRRYPKVEKRNPSPPIPLIISTQPHLQVSKGETQHNPIPNGTDTLGKFRTYKNAGKNINVPNHVFQNTSWTQHAPTSRNLSPQLNAKKQVNA